MTDIKTVIFFFTTDTFDHAGCAAGISPPLLVSEFHHFCIISSMIIHGKLDVNDMMG